MRVYHINSYLSIGIILILYFFRPAGNRPTGLFINISYFLVPNSIIQNISPVQQTVQNCPTDGSPIHIGNDCRKHCAKQNYSFGVICKGKTGVSPVPGAFLYAGFACDLFSIYQIFRRNTEILCNLGQRINVRLGFSRFPIGHRLASYMKLLRQLLLIDALFQTDPFYCGMYYIHLNHLRSIML